MLLNAAGDTLYEYLWSAEHCRRYADEFRPGGSFSVNATITSVFVGDFDLDRRADFLLTVRSPQGSALQVFQKQQLAFSLPLSAADRPAVFSINSDLL